MFSFEPHNPVRLKVVFMHKSSDSLIMRTQKDVME